MEEEYNQMDHHENSTTTPRGNYLYSSPNLGSNYRRTNEGTNVVSNNNHHHHEQQTQMLMNTTSFHLQSDHTDCFLQTGGGGGGTTHSIVKTEASTSQHLEKFHYPLLSKAHHQHQQQDHLENDNSNEVDAIKAKIIAHPQYSNILEAFIDCQKVGAPTEVVNRLSAAREDFEVQQRSLVRGRDAPKDPELDQFMEAYYDMLVKYREELTKPIQEAMDFMGRIESQLNLLCNGSVKVFSSDERCEGIGSSEEDVDNNGGETEVPEIDPRAEDRELKNHLLRKYSGYLSSLKQELSKKKKKGKLPKDARQKLLSWWELHYKWPYPSETEKVALAEATGLDQKQINNWFINQRKRHWKPSEDMQFMVMDGLHAQNAALYMDGHYMGDSHYRLGP